MPAVAKLRGMESLTRVVRNTAMAGAVLATMAGAAAAQDDFRTPADTTQDARILQRWVGAKFNGLPFWLDFYGDSMLVVSDRFNEFPVQYVLTPRTLTVYGDSALIFLLATAFNPNRADEDFGFQDRYEMRYRFSLERLILEADGNRRITMTPQPTLARPIERRWMALLADGSQMELFLNTNGTVSRRTWPGGARTVGTWERQVRDIVFDWSPDSLETPDSSLIWVGFYDLPGQAILFDSLGPGTGTAIFRRIVR